jgi:hypothetical protein
MLACIDELRFFHRDYIQMAFNLLTEKVLSGHRTADQRSSARRSPVGVGHQREFATGALWAEWSTASAAHTNAAGQSFQRIEVWRA